MGPSFSQLPWLVCLPSSISSWQRAILKKKKSLSAIYTQILVLQCVTESTNQHLQAQVPTAGFLIVCCAELSSSSEYKSPSDHFLYRCELPFLHSACFKAGIQFLIHSKPAQDESPWKFLGVLIPGQLPVNCPGIKYTQKFSGCIVLVLVWQEFHHAGAVWQPGISADERSRVVFHQTAGDRKREQKMP